jgi:hypothetical protein
MRGQNLPLLHHGCDLARVGHRKVMEFPCYHLPFRMAFQAVLQMLQAKTQRCRGDFAVDQDKTGRKGAKKTGETSQNPRQKLKIHFKDFDWLTLFCHCLGFCS